MFELNWKKALGKSGVAVQGQGKPKRTIHIASLKNSWKKQNKLFLIESDSTYRIDQLELQKQLRTHGFKNLNEYQSSEYWKNLLDRYQKSKLYKKCLVCGYRKYSLALTRPDQIMNEQLHELLPLCKSHLSRLAAILRRENRSLRDWCPSLRKCVRMDERGFNRNLRKYHIAIRSHLDAIV